MQLSRRKTCVINGMIIFSVMSLMGYIYHYKVLHWRKVNGGIQVSDTGILTNANNSASKITAPALSSNSTTNLEYPHVSGAEIPHIIHQTWESEYVPKQFGEWIQSWSSKNPSWEYWLWREEDAQLLLQKHFPQYQKMYKKYRFNVNRADVRRYFALYMFGGVYADLDINCLRPISEIMDKHVCVVSQEPDVHAHLLMGRQHSVASNALIACRPGHPFMKMIIENLARTANLHSLLDATGPLLLDRLLRVYQSEAKNRRKENDVFLAPPDYFQPTFDNAIIKDIKQTCAKNKKLSLPPKVPLSVFEKQKKLCSQLELKEYANFPEPHSYSDHHWVHTYWHPYIYNGKKENVKNIDIKRLVASVKFWKDMKDGK